MLQPHTNTIAIQHDTRGALTRTHLVESHQWGWQKVTSNTVDDIDTLASILELNASAVKGIAAANTFELRVPLPFISRMRVGDINDPLLLQVLPLKKELINPVGLTHDPLNESDYNQVPGLVHKYKGRVLLTAAVSCPINCRYCFRRHFPYDKNRLTPRNWQPALNYIRKNSSIKEVILSGGEPLLLNDRTLTALLDEIEAIAHVKYIRIHSRYPIVVPQRLTETLCDRLLNSRCRVSLVLHSNHPNEIDDHVTRHLRPLVNSKVTLLNQSVLLRHINDDANVLSELSEKLYDAGVLPYYLHATDPVTGTAHFQVKDEDAQKIGLALANRLPGYLVPTLVREVSDRPGKTRLPLTP